MDLQSLLEPVVEDAGYELLLAEYITGQRVLRVYIDRHDDAEVTLDDCSAVSQQVSGVLDVEDPISEEYNLEVSSPGADRPLTKLEHFREYLGERAKIQLFVPLDGRRRFPGVLVAADQDDAGEVFVEIDVDGEVFRLPMSEMERARLAPVLK